MKHFNNLTPAEAERLAVLSGECGEVIQAIGKILQHGYESTNPDESIYVKRTNREMLEIECGDVRQAMIRLCNWGDLSKKAIHERADKKAITIEKYLHHNNDDSEI